MENSPFFLSILVFSNLQMNALNCQKHIDKKVWTTIKFCIYGVCQLRWQIPFCKWLVSLAQSLLLLWPPKVSLWGISKMPCMPHFFCRSENWNSENYFISQTSSRRVSNNLPQDCISCRKIYSLDRIVNWVQCSFWEDRHSKPILDIRHIL